MNFKMALVGLYCRAADLDRSLESVRRTADPAGPGCTARKSIRTISEPELGAKLPIVDSVIFFGTRCLRQ
jgi:hypothetical protein